MSRLQPTGDGVLQPRIGTWGKVLLSKPTHPPMAKEDLAFEHLIAPNQLDQDARTAERLSLARQLPKRTVALVLAGGRGSRLRG